MSCRPFDKLGQIVLAAVLALCPPAVLHAQSAEQAPDTMDARLLACAACHGAQGQGTTNDYFPRLAGKPAGYLMNQLVAFRDGRRRYPPMNYLLEYIPDAYLQKMADHFAALRPPPLAQSVSDASGALLARGRSLVADGDPSHGVPACSRCHGPALTGMEPAIPGLVGLHAKLHQRAARRVAVWHAHGAITRLHATGRRQPDRERRHGRRGLAVLGADTGRSVAGPARHAADAAHVRQRTQMTGVGRMRVGWMLVLLGLCSISGAARADEQLGRCERRIPRPRRRLHRLPHHPRRRVVRRRPADADAVRHAVFVQHHARSDRPASARGPPISSTAPCTRAAFPMAG